MQETIDPPPAITEIENLPEGVAPKISSTTLGILFGLIAAVGYSLANISLREMANTHEGLSWQIWVTFMKAVPAALVAWGLIAYRASNSLVAFPPLRMLPLLFVTGLVMQFGGNLCFQWSLAHIGLALTTPLCFATLICTGAGLGRVWLGEPINKLTVFAMLALIVSITLISMGIGTVKEQTWEVTSLAILTACISGISYGSCGVVIRKMVKQLPISASLVMFSSTGVLVLGTISLSQYGIGLETISHVTNREWLYLWAAGWANAVAFFAVGGAMQRLEVVRVNLLNASQVAMCAIAGVLIFGETLTVWLVAGTLLTIAGLLLMGLKRRKTVR